MNAGETLPTNTPLPPVSSVMRANSSAEVSREVDEILLLKTVKSAAARQPKTAVVAVAQVSAVAELVKPEPVRSVKYSEFKPRFEEMLSVVVVAFVVVELRAVKF